MRVIALLALVVLLAACQGPLQPASTPGAKAEAPGWWDSADNLADELEFGWEQLRAIESGTAAQTPWPGYWWPNTQDSINARWLEGERSPAEKYAAAFGAPDVPQQVSSWLGINAGEEWAHWRGICDGWVAASIQEPAPGEAIVYNGVRFYPSDIAALMSFLYARYNKHARLVASNCEQPQPIEVDEAGRPRNNNCRSLNAASLHVATVNLLGKRQQAFAIDESADGEKWNQPVRSFRIVSQREIDVLRAATLTRSAGVTRQRVAERVAVPFGYQIQGQVELPASGILFVEATAEHGAELGFGMETEDGQPATCAGTQPLTCTVTGEPGSTAYFGAISVPRPDDDPDADGALLTVDTVAPEKTSDYAFNGEARRFVEVVLELTWIYEPHPSTEPLGDKVGEYSAQSTYHYVLELDDSSRIIGGEYVGGSLTDHPDYAWLPYGGVVDDTQRGVSYKHVKALLNRSRGE